MRRSCSPRCKSISGIPSQTRSSHIKKKKRATAVAPDSDEDDLLEPVAPRKKAKHGIDAKKVKQVAVKKEIKEEFDDDFNAFDAAVFNPNPIDSSERRADGTLPPFTFDEPPASEIPATRSTIPDQLFPKPLDLDDVPAKAIDELKEQELATPIDGNSVQQPADDEFADSVQAGMPQLRGTTPPLDANDFNISDDEEEDETIDGNAHEEDEGFSGE